MTRDELYLDAESSWGDVVKVFCIHAKEEGPWWTFLSILAIGSRIVSSILNNLAIRFEDHVVNKAKK